MVTAPKSWKHPYYDNFLILIKTYARDKTLQMFKKLWKLRNNVGLCWEIIA